MRFFSFQNTFNELFPAKWSFVVFVMYIALFINHGLLVTASQEENNSYDYNITVAVLLSEIVKFLASLFFYNLQNPCRYLLRDTKKHVKLLWLYFLPAILYCLYNNLSYVNLETYDPTTYFILLQLRVVLTGAIFQVIFKKELSKKQWASLVILTAGCMMKQFPFNEIDYHDKNKSTKQFGVTFSFSSFLILIQVLCSCIAGVYNEYILKYQGVDVDIYLQNAFMYWDSIICNLIFILLTGDIRILGSITTIQKFLHFKVILVILNNAILGIVTSLFLRSLNSILKNFASALELIFTAVLSRIIFSIPIHLNTAVSIFLIILASLIYSQSPVKNQVPNKGVDKISTNV